MSVEYAAIIFDMDGLMVDTERQYVHVMRQVAASFGRSVTDATLAKMMGRSPLESLRIYCADLQISAKPEDVLSLREDMVFELFKTDLAAMPGLHELIAFLRPRFRLALATSSRRKFVDLILARLGLTGIFEAEQTGDELARGKPDPEIYNRVIKQLAVRADQCIVLEDSENGVRAGRNAGCYTIAVPNEHTQKQNFSPANHIAHDLHAAKEHIRELTGK